jgi:hypothetical protein
MQAHAEPELSRTPAIDRSRGARDNRHMPGLRSIRVQVVTALMFSLPPSPPAFARAHAQ